MKMNIKSFLMHMTFRKAIAIAGLIGGLASTAAGVAGTIDPHLSAVLTTVALYAAAAGDSITKIKQTVAAVKVDDE